MPILHTSLHYMRSISLSFLPLFAPRSYIDFQFWKKNTPSHPLPCLSGFLVSNTLLSIASLPGRRSNGLSYVTGIHIHLSLSNLLMAWAQREAWTAALRSSHLLSPFFGSLQHAGRRRAGIMIGVSSWGKWDLRGYAHCTQQKIVHRMHGSRAGSKVLQLTRRGGYRTSVNYLCTTRNIYRRDDEVISFVNELVL